MSARCCQAEGCTEDLVALGKPYFLKKKICERHMRAEEVRKTGCGDSLWRFCQQCGRLEPLSNFDGTRRNCRASLSRRKIQPETLSSFSSRKPRKLGSDQCNKLQLHKQKQRTCTTVTDDPSVTEDDTMQVYEPGLDAAVAGVCTATVPAGWEHSFAQHSGAQVHADGCSNNMSLDHVYAQIQQQQQLQQQQLLLKQQLHSAMTTCADTYTVFGVGAQLATEGSTTASPVALPMNLGVFGRFDSVASVSSGADEAMQAHVESIMMAELVAELTKAQQQQQQQSMLQRQTTTQQELQHAGLAALGPAAPCDAGSSNLPTLQLLAQPTLQQHRQQQQQQQVVQLQQQQTLLAPSYQHQQGYHTHCHSSSCSQHMQCMPGGYTPAAAPAAAAVSCFGAPACSAGPPPAAAVHAVGPLGAGMTMGQAKGRSPVMADRLQTLTSQMAQMQAMLLQMQQSLDLARR